MEITLAHPLPGHAQTGFFGRREEFWENGKYIPAMWHDGADFGAGAGTPIRAMHNGKVTVNGWIGQGGNAVQINGDVGRSLYCHMREVSPVVKVGQRVVAGQVIGYVGMTGTATGNHLHVMFDHGTGWVDPVPFMTTNQGEEELTEEQDMMLRVLFEEYRPGKTGKHHRGPGRALLEDMPDRVLDAGVARTGSDAAGKPRTGRTSLRRMIGHHEHQIGLSRRILERLETATTAIKKKLGITDEDK